MKKLLAVFLLGVLFASGLAVSNASRPASIAEKKIETIALSETQLVDTGAYVSVTLPESTSQLMNPGAPVIPRITRVYYLPFQSHNIEVSVDFSSPATYVLEKALRPAPQPIIGSNNAEASITPLETVYQNSRIYPENSYTYSTSTGLLGKQHIVFLSVTVYPVRYSPRDNLLFVSDEITITVTYEEPMNPMLFADVYDLLIIAPAKYETALQPLVHHKNSFGMNTTLVTLETIYSQITEGRDDAENVKLFIKKTMEDYGITYVLLVGGMKPQKEQWIVPVRYTNNHVGEGYELGVLSDLYFADIYKDNGTAFEDWDSNGNGIFAEFTPTSKDIIDGSPDVYVGRLACTSVREVRLMVEKIINYEKIPADEAWFKRLLLVGGDTYPESGGEGAYEAELYQNVSASYMTGFEVERLWASTGTLTGQKSVEKAINTGVGFMHCAGHANPSILVTHPPLNKQEKITILGMYNIPPLNAMYALLYQDRGIAGFIEELQERWMPRLKNGEKQPVVVVGGCHNSQFNTTLLNIGAYGFTYAYGWGVHVPKCWSWWLTSKQNGGAIATMGNTGLGMGLPGFDYPNGLDGWLLPRFFYHYGQQNRSFVGEAHSAAIADYVNEFDINGNKAEADRQMVEQWVLLGDPSLKIGGYS
jgi:hypothetical protein